MNSSTVREINGQEYDEFRKYISEPLKRIKCRNITVEIINEFFDRLKEKLHEYNMPDLSYEEFESLIEGMYEDYSVGIFEEFALFLNMFDMIPDVRSHLNYLYQNDESFFYNIKNDPESRIDANISHALKHKGNITLNIFGATRHGKSTVARWVAKKLFKARYGTTKNWEQKIIYEHSYSGSTNRLINRINDLKKQNLSDEEILNQLKGTIFIHDEVLIEHEKDSIKAKEDITNILETCAATQMDFIFVTPKRREFGQFSLMVAGISPGTQTNLSFYFDTRNQCQGLLITPNVPETITYQQIKKAGIMEMLSQGGRRIAEVKAMNGAIKIHNKSLQIQGTAPEHLLDKLLETAPLNPTRHLNRDITIFKTITKEGLSVGKVAKEHGLTDARTYQILGTINQAIGISFEKYLETIQPQLWKRLGGKSEPDLINEEYKFVVSCKTMSGNKAKKTDKAIRSSKPEYAYMKKGYSGYLIIFWMDDNTFTMEPIL